MNYLNLIRAITQLFPVIILMIIVVALILLLVFKPTRDYLAKFLRSIEWLVFEILSMLSGKDSFFSMKRWQTTSAFIIAQYGMLQWLPKLVTLSDYLIWNTIEFGVAGYLLKEILKENKLSPPDKEVVDGSNTTKTEN